MSEGDKIRKRKEAQFFHFLKKDTITKIARTEDVEQKQNSSSAAVVNSDSVDLESV